MWRKLLLVSLVLSFAFSMAFAADVSKMTPAEKALYLYDQGAELKAADKALIGSELAAREAQIRNQRIQESRENYVTNSDLRSALVEGFEGTFPPAGWTMISNNTSNGIIQSTPGNTGTYSARFSSYSSASDYTQYMITPQLSVTAGDDALQFYYKAYSSWNPEHFMIGVSTTDNDPASFTWGDEIIASVSSSWTDTTLDLSAYQGSNIYVGLKYVSNYLYYLYIDDFAGPEIYVAPEPPAAVLDPLPADAAAGIALDPTLSWAASFSATGYKLSLGTDNPPTNMMNASDLGDVLTYTPTPLAFSTTYYWSVTPYNEYGDGTGTVVWSFTTMDDPTISTFPHTEGFEGDEPGWTVLNNNGDSDSWNTNSTSYPNTGSQSAAMYTDYNSGANDDYLISPPVELTGNQRMSFWYRVRSSSEPNDFQILLSTTGTDPADFTNTLLPLAEYSNTTYESMTVDLSAYTGTVYIAFHVPAGGLDGWYLYIDDVLFEDLPAIAVAGLSDLSVDFGPAPVGATLSYDVTISNSGGADLVITGLDVAAPFSSSYTGTIAVGASDVATILYEPTAAGDFSETLNLLITGDYDGDDTLHLAGSAYDVLTGLNEGFEGAEFPPANWVVTTTDASGDAWESANDGTTHGPGSVAEGSLAAMADIYNMSSGTESSLYTPVVDLTGLANPRLNFWWQCMTGWGTQPSLTVLMSVDAGATWTELYYQEADGAADDWLNVKILVPEVTAMTQFEFVAFSDYGSYNMFLDAVMVEDAPMATPFFSEYMEGSGNNKALEIYNPTATALNLDDYQIAQAVNGGGWQYYHAFPEGATLDPGETWLIVTDGSFPEMQAIADEIMAYPSVVHHNGDDARALIQIGVDDTTFLDIIGTPDFDPGSGWDVAGVAVATQNHNLVRKPDVETGNVDWVASAGTDVDNSEWIVFEEDFWYGLGYHNEPYPLPGDACDLPIAYGNTNDPAATGSIESYGADWYVFTNDGTFDFVTVSLCDSDYDTKLEVWEDCDSTSYLAYNDDACGTRSEVTLNSLPAGDYYVKVYGYSSASGNYSLSITGTNGVPDFVVSDMVYYGQDTLDVTVSNIGDGDSPGYFGTDYHGLSIDGVYLGYVAVDGVALLSGESYVYQITGVNFDFLGAGMHEVAFEADVDNDVAEIDETNNADTLMIDVAYPPLAPRHLTAMAGEGMVTLNWSTAVIPPPAPGVLSRSVNGVAETRTKPAVVLSEELIAKRDAARSSAFREVGDTCEEALELTAADGTVINAPYAPFWYAYTPAADGFLTASSDGLATTDTKVYAYDGCGNPYIDYDDDGGAGLQSILTIPVTGGTTYYFEWSDQYSSAAFDWALSYTDYMQLADLAVTEMYLEDDAVMAVVTNIGDLDAAGVSCHWWVNGVDVAYEYTSLLAPAAADTLGLYGFSWENLGSGTFNVALEVDFWGSVDELSEENNIDSIQVVIEDPDYMPTYNVYRDDALLVAGLESVNRFFDGEYVDVDVMPDVEYTYYVTQILEDLSETIPSNSASATPWAPIFWPFPHVEDYEGIVDNLLPEGYVVEEIGEPDGANWEVGDSTYFEGNSYNYWHVPGGTQFAAIDDDGWGTGVNGNEILWTPWVDLSTAVAPQIMFQYTVRGGNGGEFLVFDGTNVTPYPLEDSPSAWVGVLFGLGDYVGDVVRFGFHYDDNGGWAYGMAVDNIVLEEAPQAGTITGTVTDAGGNPIGFANVHAMGAFADAGAMTDAAGIYSIDVPAGEYTVEVMRVNYSPSMAQVTVESGVSTTLDFTLDMYLPAPENLMAYPSAADTTIGLMWAPPLPMGQIAMDDGSYEGLYWVSNPSTSNDYWATHFKAAITPGYVINEIAILSTADEAGTAFENVWVLGSVDTTGAPDFNNVIWTAAGHDAFVWPEMGWDFYPVAASPGAMDFWVVVQYPDASTTGPYIAADEDHVGSTIAANAVDGDGNPMWGTVPFNLAIRAFVGEPSTGRSVVLHSSKTTSAEKMGLPHAVSVKENIVSAGSVDAPDMLPVSRELLNYNVYRSLDPAAFGDVYANVAGEMFNDDDFAFDTQYFYAVSAVYDEGESMMSNVDAFTFWSPLFLNHYEGFAYPNGTPLEDIGWVTNDGAGNVAPNFNIEDEMLHFDWSPTATDFYQSVTSPVANFAGATVARLSFYMYFDDYNDGDNGTLDFSFALSNDGFATQTEIFTHNDSVYGDIEDFFIFNISDIVAGSDGWQLRLVLEGATSFTMDNLWVDDIMVESDVYAGPGAFNLLSPANDESIMITSANVSTGSLLFAWESAGDDMRYAVQIEGTLGSVIVPFDTSATEVLIPYSVLSAAFDLAGMTSATGTWHMLAYNEMGEIWCENGPFNLTIGSTVGTDDAFIPDVFALYQNYPNPFNPVTTITYDIPEASHVKLVVYNLVGQPVRTLVSGFQNPSRYTLAWNGLSDAGLPVSSGIYVYRLETDSYTKTMKMMFLK